LNATTKTFRQLSAGKAEKNEENRAKCEEKVGEADLVKSEPLESFEDDPNFLFSSDILMRMFLYISFIFSFLLYYLIKRAYRI